MPQRLDNLSDKVWSALDEFRIELPSWGFANTGTRFGKFVQAAAATTIEEKFADAGQVNALTGASPTVALHVLWDLPQRQSRRPGHPGAGEEVRRQGRLHQSQSLSGPGLQVRLHRQP